MIDTKELLERARRRAPQPEDVMDSLIRRRARKERNRRISAAALAIGLALVTFAGLIRTFRVAERATSEPTDIFSRVHGWIVYGDTDGIWAIDPSRGKEWSDTNLVADPGSQGGLVKLSDLPGTPLAWSSDGSKLLIWRYWNEGTRERFGGEGVERWNELSVLSADGSETHLMQTQTWISGASLSPDGSKVVYALLPTKRHRGAIYVIHAEGGAPHILATPHPRRPSVPTFELGYPTFSPDGKQIAYVGGGGDWGNKLWVMNADGSGARLLLDPDPDLGLVGKLAWSPDGSRLAFSKGSETGIWVALADGSGLWVAIAGGLSPEWSPDGSRIAYDGSGGLAISRSDGTHSRYFRYGRSGPWNPLPLESDHRESTGDGDAPFFYAIAALALAGVVVHMWRGRRTKWGT